MENKAYFSWPTLPMSRLFIAGVIGLSPIDGVRRKLSVVLV